MQKFFQITKVKLIYIVILWLLLPMFARIEWIGSSRVDYKLSYPILGFYHNLLHINSIFSIAHFIFSFIIAYIVVSIFIGLRSKV